ncbi:MAG TPA: WbqC family protein [Kofleriaceae bacterium]
MIVAAHQPAYLPWLGYLAKLAAADLFVVMDDLQYEAQNFQNRNRVKLAHGAAWLTVPLLRGSLHDRILDKQIDNAGNPRQHWQRRTWRTLELSYGRAPYFRVYADELRDVYMRTWTSLVELDLHMLELARRWLAITTPIIRSSSLDLGGAKTERIIELCRAVGARTYLSGTGGSTSYLDIDMLARAGITTRWQRFGHPVYPQRFAALGFVPKLAFLDLVLNCGPASRDVLFACREAA